MAVLTATAVKGRTVLAGTATAWPGTSSFFATHDDAADNKAAGAYVHVDLEFSANEADLWTSWMLAVTELITGGSMMLKVRNETGGTLVKGTVVYVSGYSSGQSRFLIAAADADANTTPAMFVLDADLGNNTNGVAYKDVDVTGLNTSGFGAAGDKVYLSATAGQFTTAPASSYQQAIGIVTSVHATTGSIRFMLSSVRRENMAALNVAQTFTASQTFNPSNTRDKIVVQHGGAMRLQLGVLDGTTTKGAIWGPVVTPSDTNQMLDSDGSDTHINSQQYTRILYQGNTRCIWTTNGMALVENEAGPSTGSRVLMLRLGSAWTPVADSWAMWGADLSAANTGWFLKTECGAQLVFGDSPTAAGFNCLWMGDSPTLDFDHAAFFGDGNEFYVQVSTHGHLRYQGTNTLGWNGNGISIGGSVPGSGSKVIEVTLGTAWTPIADAAAIWVADVNAGDARVFIQGENAPASYQPARIGRGMLFSGTGDISTSGDVFSPYQTGGEGIIVGHNAASNIGVIACGHQATAWHPLTFHADYYYFYATGAGPYFGISTLGTVVGASVPGTGTNVLKIESGTAWTAVADSIALRSADSAAANANLWVTNEQGVLKQLSGLDKARTTTQTVTDSAALTADDTLLVPVAAGRTYHFRLTYHFTTVNSSGVQVDLNGGTATMTSLRGAGHIISTSAGTFVGAANFTALTSTVGVTATGTSAKVVVEGCFVVNAAGTFGPRFAQNAETGAAESVIAGINSTLVLTAIA